MSEVDITQSPADFAQLAKNTAPADPQGQPKEPEPGGATPPATTPIETPKGGEPPKPKEGEQGIKPETPPAPADPQGQPTAPKTPEEIEKEQKNAAQKITELGEQRSKMFKTYLGLVEENPDVIKDINKRDPELADQIVKEHWGHDSFEELMAYARVEDLKDSDPDRAKAEKELLDLKRTNKTILGQLRSNAEGTFYTNKGIQNNPFDPNYQAVQTALKKVSPSLIESNYAEALNIAHSIAFPGKTAEQIEVDKKKIALATGAGTPVSSGVGGSPVTPSKLSDVQRGFMENLGITPK